MWTFETMVETRFSQVDARPPASLVDFAGNPNPILGVPSPFFPGILLSRKPPETQGKRLVLEKIDG